MAKFALIVALIAATVFQINGHSVEDRRIKKLQRRMFRMNKLLLSVQSGQLGCNTSVVNVMSDTVSEISGLVEHLYKGPLLAKVDLSRGSKQSDQVLLKLPDSMERCLESFDGKCSSRIHAEIVCLQQILWRFKVPTSARRIRQATNTVKKFSYLPHPTSPINLRVRKEYRALTELERTRFHDAMNDLYEDGIIADFVLVHKQASSGAHVGPAFLPWHRAFITSLENALDEKRPGVTLPYWDSTIDNSMDNPTNSKIWTSDFLGNGAGDVITGSFGGWFTDHGPLQREYATRAGLISKEKVENIMTLCHFSDISVPNQVQSLEGPHNGVHLWVGGDMSSTASAPWDPVFYLHHCYIDYLWEKFRERQVDVCGVDPVTDYDYTTTKEHHSFDDQMLLQEYTIAQGLDASWTTSIYRYEDAPTCENNCSDSDHLYCAQWLNCCVPRPRFQGPTDITAGVSAAGLPATTTQDPSLVFASTTHCDHYLDPDCHHEHSMFDDKNGVPLQPALELKIIEEMVPVNRGRLFAMENPREVDTRSLLTLEEDIKLGLEKRRKWEQDQQYREKA